MKALKRSVLVGAAAVAAIGLGGGAVAEILHRHVLTIRLPDGSVEQIRYVGDTPPVVQLQSGLAPVAALPTDSLFDADSPFAALERISAQMDREAAALLEERRGLSASPSLNPGGLAQIDLARLPPGTRGYSMVSTMTGDRVCTRTTQYGPLDDSGRSKAVTRISGDCGSSSPPSSATRPTVTSPPEAVAHPMLQRVSAKD